MHTHGGCTSTKPQIFYKTTQKDCVGNLNTPYKSLRIFRSGTFSLKQAHTLFNLQPGISVTTPYDIIKGTKR